MKTTAIFFMTLALCEYTNGTETYKGSDIFEIPLFIITSIFCLVLDGAMSCYIEYKKKKDK